jgi:hypothetical protein
LDRRGFTLPLSDLQNLGAIEEMRELEESSLKRHILMNTPNKAAADTSKADPHIAPPTQPDMNPAPDKPVESARAKPGDAKKK